MGCFIDTLKHQKKIPPQLNNSKLRKSIIILILFTCFFEAKACLNYYHSIDNTGHLHSADDLKKAFNTNFNLKLIEKKLKKIEEQLIKEHDYKHLSDYAVLLLKAGKTKESLEILLQLSNHYPDEYQIATNLGTAYELNGEIEKAIQFINRGLELNPNSHEGSEWVHIKVLETKLKLKNDTLFLLENSVLNLAEEDKKSPIIRNQILIQCQERFPFSPGPNPIMASLLIDLGDCYANTSSIEFAKVLYTIAKIYFSADEDLADSKINDMINLRNKFAHIKPERRRTDGDNIKISGITYKSMLDDNNVSSYKIDWTNIITDLDKLLSYANLEKIELNNIDPDQNENKVDSIIVNPKKGKVNENESPSYLIYTLATILLLLIGFILYKKRAKNN